MVEGQFYGHATRFLCLQMLNLYVIGTLVII